MVPIFAAWIALSGSPCLEATQSVVKEAGALGCDAAFGRTIQHAAHQCFAGIDGMLTK